jgi:hypothetical protein
MNPGNAIPCALNCVTFNVQSNYEEMKGENFMCELYMACDVFKSVFLNAVN